MLGGLLAALRPVLAVVIVSGAATVMVAPALDLASQRAESRAASAGAAPLRNENPQPTDAPTDDPDPSDPPKPDFGTLLRECLDSRDPDSDACAAAALESGMSYEDFRAKIVAKLKPEPTKKPEPKPEPTKKPEPVVSTAKKPEPVKNSFDALLRQCLETRDENSDACIRAGEASGLGAADWAAKIRGKLEASRGSDFATYFEKCLATRDINSDHCIRAEELSGLSFADFEAKFNSKLAAKDGSKLAAKDGADFWTHFEKCLDTRDIRSDACLRAQQLIGFNDADFHAKFERYLAERDAKSGKVTAAPKPTTSTFDTVLKACGETHDRNSDPCLRALVLSGLQPAEFWAKVEAKFGPFH